MKPWSACSAHKKESAMRDEIEAKVTALTNTLSKKCHGQGAVVALGATLNLFASVIAHVPDPIVKLKAADLLRNMANTVEAEVKAALDKKNPTTTTQQGAGNGLH